MPTTFLVQPSDADFLFGLYVAVRGAEVADCGWSPEQQAAFLRMQFQLQQRAYAMQFPGADHRVIWHEGTPAGQFLVARLAGEIRLIDIALLPEFRGLGLAAALIRELQTEARQAGKLLRLTVRRGNPAARRLYERLGFVVLAQTELDEAMEWRPPTCV